MSRLADSSLPGIFCHGDYHKISAHVIYYAMDKIIYFYVNGKREQDTPPFRIYTYRRKGYELLRVGFAGWLVKRWESCGKTWEERRDTVEKSGGERENFWTAAFHRLFGPVRLRREKRRVKQELEAEAFFWQRQFEELRTEIDEHLKDERDEVWFSCEEELMPLLVCGKDACLWAKSWPYPFFENYFHMEWVEHMLSYAVLPHYIVLGYYRELPGILWERAARMKSLKWILPERLYDETLQEFLEDFYEEYGIAAAVQLLGEEESFWQTILSGRAPCNVLDFSEEEKIPSAELAKGSIWIDMSSMEGKRRRLEERNTGIRYFSLKKEWKQPVLP